MKVLLASLTVVLLMLSMTPLAASSFGTGSSNHVPFSPDKSFRMFTIPNTTLMSPNAQLDGYFGSSVSMSGNLVTVGAPEESDPSNSSLLGVGNAYVFNATSGASVANLTSPNAQEGGDFGASVSMSGKLVTVGAPYETADGYSYAGHAYVFNAKTGALITNLTSPNAQKTGLFGYSVSISGGIVCVSAPHNTVDGYYAAGQVYLFNATSGASITTLTNPNPQDDGFFGSSVSMSGKLVTVGARGNSADGYGGAGEAYVYNLRSGALIQTLISPNAQDYGYFGWSVSMSGKLVTVGAFDETADGYSYAGHAYVFNAKTGALIQTLTSFNARGDGYFGYSVSMSGKLVTVGAYQENANGCCLEGRAYVFNAKTGASIANLTSPNSQDLGAFGYSVSISGKLVTVGAPYEAAASNSSIYYAGNAYIFFKV